MNTIFKRSVAGILTAGMLLTGLTACKTPEERQEASLLSAFNKDTNVEFEKILYSTVEKHGDEYQLYITGYDKLPENSTDTATHHIYKEAQYIITEEDYYSYKYNIVKDCEDFFPFANELSDYINKIIEKYDPEYVDKALLSREATRTLDQLVEEYCK